MIPIHLEVHWSLITVTLSNRIISFYDSQGIHFKFCVEVSKYNAHFPPPPPPLSYDWSDIILALDTIPQRIKFSHKTPLKCWQRKGLPKDSPSRQVAIYNLDPFSEIHLDFITFHYAFPLTLYPDLFRAGICLYLQNNFFRINYNQETQLANVRVQQDVRIQSKKIQVS